MIFMRSVNARVGVKLARRQVVRALGYVGRRQPPSGISSLVDEYVTGAGQLIDARYWYGLEDVTVVEGLTSVIRDSVAFESRVVAGLLERCSKIIVFLTTIGGELEAKVRNLAEDGSLVHAYVLDAVGSIAAEQVAGHVETLAAEMARAEGLVAGRRFSPGYCDWNITQQKSLFRLAEAHSIGVALSELNLMIPRKSVSGIIGLGSSRSGVEEYDPCLDCARKDCPGRRDR
jgi:hypothetical protein